MRRRTLSIFGSVAVLGLGAGGLVWATWPASPRTPDWSYEYITATPPIAGSPEVSDSSEYDLTARPPDLIEAGTIIDRTAPPGWSHLVIQSFPHIRADQQAALPRLTVNHAAWMFTAFLADVRRNEHGHFRFRTVGLGLGAKIDGHYTILRPEADKPPGVHLGWINREILSKGYEVQRKAVVVFRGPTMGLVDTPVWFRCGDTNRLIRFRYALLVDAATGRLDTLLWRHGAECESDTAIWLAPDTLDPAELVVDQRKMGLFGVPSDDAFAVDQMPAGRLVPLPTDLRPLAGHTRFTVPEAHALESRLRQLLVGK